MSNDNAPRVTAPPLSTMDDKQRAAYDRITASPYGPYGPRMVLLQDGMLSAAWAGLGDALTAAGLPATWREMAILVIASAWRAPFQWNAHAAAARKAGLSEAIVTAIRTGQTPAFGDPALATLHAYTVALVIDRAVSDDLYAHARGILGDKGLVQFTAFIGHYQNVAMTLVAHQVPLPPGAEPPHFD